MAEEYLRRDLGNSTKRLASISTPCPDRINVTQSGRLFARTSRSIKPNAEASN